MDAPAGAILAVGFLMGVKHALEADHVAAVVSLATRSSSLRDTVKVATWWGVGHGVALVVFGSVIVALDVSLPQGTVRIFEAAVGATLILLGVDVLRRLRAGRVHFHPHHHRASGWHFHAHAHDGAVAHDRADHEHEHPRGLLPRALVVGSVHGIAGSAALILVSLPALHSGLRALAYLAVFAIGTVLGMVLFSVAISLPLRLPGRRLQWASTGLEATVGALTIALGGWIAVQALIGATAG
jgi:sulfite exporter TauE/SafE